MNKCLSYVVLFILIATSANAQKPDKVLWFDKPARFFNESLLLGNGTQGATVFGGVTKEKILLNDATLWSGEPLSAVSYTHLTLPTKRIV